MVEVDVIVTNFITSRRRSGETELGESVQLNGLNKGEESSDGILQGLG